MNNRDIKVHS